MLKKLSEAPSCKSCSRLDTCAKTSKVVGGLLEIEKTLAPDDAERNTVSNLFVCLGVNCEEWDGSL